MDKYMASLDIDNMSADEKRALAVRRKPRLVTFEAKYLGRRERRLEFGLRGA